MNMPQGPGGPQVYPGQPPHAPFHQDPHDPYPGPSPESAGAPTTRFAPIGPGGPQPSMPKAFSAIWTLGLVSLAATVLGLSLKEDGNNAWHSVHAWGALAIVGAALTLAPALAHSISLTKQRAWQVAVCGAGALLLFWVLFVLPSVGSNTSLLTTVGAAAGVIAAWIAPGRDQAAGDQPGDQPPQHTW
jgi:hypothetical protein